MSFGLFRRAYCDSLALLERARADGLPADVQVLSASPAMILGGHAESVHREFDYEKRRALDEQTLALSGKIRDAVARAGYGSSQANLLAGHALHLQAMIAHAASLDERDHQDPVLVVRGHTGHGGTDRLFGAPWSGLLAGRDNVTVVEYDLPMDDKFLLQGGESPSLMARIRFAPWHRILFRCLEFVSRVTRFVRRRRRVFVFSTNELVMETCAVLGTRGYPLLNLDAPAPSDTTDNSGLDEFGLPPAVTESLRGVLDQHVAGWVAEPFRNDMVAACLRRCGLRWSTYDSALTAWERSLVAADPSPGDMLAVNYPGGPVALALIDAFRRRGALTFACEHGATRQFNKTHRQLVPMFEVSFVDWVMSFSQRSADICNASPFAVGRALPVGFPADYFRVRDTPSDDSYPPVLFVSTTLYAGNLQGLSGGLSDVDAARRDLKIIDDVLERIPHRTTFKPYPAIRYPDPDPVIERVRESERVDLFEDNFDLRYEIGKHRVVVTSRATSTVSWCVMSGKPLIFIDYPDHMPLTPEAREAFEAALFVVDAGAPDWLEQLRTLLSKPIDEIEALWAEKAGNRPRLVREFFTIPEPGAGIRAADEIIGIQESRAARVGTEAHAAVESRK
ncbi:MAG: hypothetical protein RIC16_16715 [Rhodospirillales bacterium]